MYIPMYIYIYKMLVSFEPSGVDLFRAVCAPRTNFFSVNLGGVLWSRQDLALPHSG